MTKYLIILYTIIALTVLASVYLFKNSYPLNGEMPESNYIHSQIPSK